jgi:hypothetical protein
MVQKTHIRGLGSFSETVMVSELAKKALQLLWKLKVNNRIQKSLLLKSITT